MLTGPPTAPRLGGVARLALAALASLAAIGGALCLSRELRGRFGASSHQMETPEAWIEASTPTSPARVAAGRTAYLASCSHCHGADASGDEGPDLHGLEVSDRLIANTILRGIKGEMPSFRKKIGDGEIVSITAYLRSLR